MSDAKICDRCGTLYNTEDYSFRLIEKTKLTKTHRDICKKCRSSYAEWLKEGRHE